MLNRGSGWWRMDPGHRDCSGDFPVPAARAAGVGQGGISELELLGSASWRWWACSGSRLNRNREEKAI